MTKCSFIANIALSFVVIFLLIDRFYHRPSIELQTITPIPKPQVELPTKPPVEVPTVELSTIPPIELQTTRKSHFHSSTVPCNVSRAVFDAVKKSQLGEDNEIYKYFRDLCNGTYLELGALDGLTYSNTYALHHALGWRGVLIELVPETAKQLKINRPNEILVLNAAVCQVEGKIHYYAAGAVSGVWEFTAPTFRAGWWKGVQLKDTVPVDCVPLREILARVNKDNFYADVFSLDVEGAELTVLQSIDFERAAFGIMIVEAGGHDPRKEMSVRTFLASKGYIYLSRIEISDWFVNENFATLYD